MTYFSNQHISFFLLYKFFSNKENLMLVANKKWINCNYYAVMNLRINSIDDIHWGSLGIGMLYEIYELVLCWLDKKIHTTTSIKKCNLFLIHNLDLNSVSRLPKKDTILNWIYKLTKHDYILKIESILA